VSEKEIIRGVHPVEVEAGLYNGEGYEVVTNKRVIRMTISADQQCCEAWGYLWTNDNLDEHVGAELHKITITDGELETSEWTKKVDDGDYLGFDDTMVMFVTFETNLGRLQFVAYNSHNGYYGHETRVEEISPEDYIKGQVPPRDCPHGERADWCDECPNFTHEQWSQQRDQALERWNTIDERWL
jgi:hypothetical protein